MAQTKTALKTFSLTNDIVEISPQDQIYKYDAAADRLINNQSPWSSEYVSVYDKETLITVP
jgi:COP9 signalosome complex subunit 5